MIEDEKIIITFARLIKDIPGENPQIKYPDHNSLTPLDWETELWYLKL